MYNESSIAGRAISLKKKKENATEYGTGIGTVTCEFCTVLVFCMVVLGTVGSVPQWQYSLLKHRIFNFCDLKFIITMLSALLKQHELRQQQLKETQSILLN